MRTTTKLRFSLLLAATLLLLASAALEVVTSLQSGVSSFSLGRRGPVLQFLRSENPFGFYVTVGVFLVLGLAMLWFGIRQGRALLKPTAPRNEHFINEQLTRIERAAPSGLRPLWIGLALAIGIAFTYRWLSAS